MDDVIAFEPVTQVSVAVAAAAAAAVIAGAVAVDAAVAVAVSPTVLRCEGMICDNLIPRCPNSYFDDAAEDEGYCHFEAQGISRRPRTFEAVN